MPQAAQAAGSDGDRTLVLYSKLAFYPVHWRALEEIVRRYEARAVVLAAPPPELSAPPEEGVPAHQEAPPSIRRQESGSGCQKRPIGIGEARSDPSSTEDLQLVLEHGRLEIPLVGATAQEQTDHAADETTCVDATDCIREEKRNETKQCSANEAIVPGAVARS